MSLNVPSSSGPASALAGVTPSDTEDLAGGPCRALYVGGAGDVSIVAEGSGSAVVLSSVPAGTILPIRAKAVRVTGTTATDIVALY